MIFFIILYNVGVQIINVFTSVSPSFPSPIDFPVFVGVASPFLLSSLPSDTKLSSTAVNVCRSKWRGMSHIVCIKHIVFHF